MTDKLTETALAFCRECLGWGDAQAQPGGVSLICNMAPGDWNSLACSSIEPVLEAVRYWCERGPELVPHRKGGRHIRGDRREFSTRGHGRWPFRRVQKSVRGTPFRMPFCYWQFAECRPKGVCFDRPATTRPPDTYAHNQGGEVMPC